MIVVLSATHVLLHTWACKASWGNDYTYIPFKGCLDPDGDEWQIVWKNPYKEE